MITAIDTNVLLELLVPVAPHAAASAKALTESLQACALIISDLVYSDLAARFATQAELDSFLASTGIRRQPSSAAALFHAGQAWSTYGRRRPSTLECPQCGSQQNVQCGACGARVQARQNVVADFVIG